MLVIFDFDGTLVDVSERWYQLHRDIANQYALPIIERESYIAAKRAGTKEATIMLNYSNNQAAITAYCKERINLIKQQQYLAFDQPFEAAFEVLEAWAKVGPMCLLSKRKSAENFHWEVENKGFKPFFRDLAPTFGKEKEEILVKMYPKEVLSSAIIISDAFEDYNMGLKLGMQPLVIGYGCRTANYFRNLGVKKVVEHCAELIPLASDFQ